MIKRIVELEQILEDAEYAYRVLNQPVMSDNEYDKLMIELRELIKLNPISGNKNSVLYRVGSNLTDGFKKVKHTILMGSIDNVFSIDELRKWCEKTAQKLNKNVNEVMFTHEFKHDGISGSLKYEDGKLILGATRGDGITGDDITNNAKMVRNVPHYIEEFTGEIRGEFIIPLTIFERVRGDAKNARNFVSGTMKSHDSNVVLNRGVHFIPFQVFDENYEEKPIRDYYEYFRNITLISAPSITTDLELLLEDVNDIASRKTYKNENHLIDGLVIKVANLKDREKLGYDKKYNDWCIAFKFEQEKAITTVKSITWQVGRDQITPVAELEPVELEGTTVSRATIHNITQIKRLRIVPGCKVEIEKAGFIIPYINRVVEDDGIIQVIIPRKCPSCQSDTKIVKVNSEVLVCTNDNCGGKLQARTEYFVKALKIDSIGESLVAELICKDLIKKPHEVMKLSFEALSTMDRMGDKKANKIYKNIQGGLVQPFSKLIESMGISEVGKSNAEKISDRFPTFKDFRSASKDDIMALEGIGESVAESLIDFIQKNSDTLDDYEKIFVIRKNEGFSTKLEGLSFVVTGAATKPRPEIEAMIKKNGGKVSSGVSKKTDILLIGSKEDESFNSSKKKKALELNIPIYNEFWLFDKLGCDSVVETADELKSGFALNDIF